MIVIGVTGVTQNQKVLKYLVFDNSLYSNDIVYYETLVFGSDQKTFDQLFHFLASIQISSDL